jgi:hypothetical protein
VHDPAGQPAVPLTMLHMFPQPPQFCVVFVFVSQPLRTLPSQFAKPALHIAIPQTPAVQLAVSFTAGQMTPQAPHEAGLLSVSTSQPFDGLPSQSA